MTTAFSVDGLRMWCGHVRTVDGLTFDVSDGEFFALLGPNGAGKTTTIEVLEGHRRRSAGQVFALGVDPERGGRRYREQIGIMLQSGGIDAELTGVETIRPQMRGALLMTTAQTDGRPPLTWPALRQPIAVSGSGHGFPDWARWT